MSDIHYIPDSNMDQTVENMNQGNKSIGDVDNDYSPRSKLEELSKSYYGEPKVIKPRQIDYGTTVMKLSDNDERLREEVAKALKV